jgi:UDP-glucose 4-epimerase
MSMRILITGIKGLIGSALKHALRLLNIDVIGIDICLEQRNPEYGNILNRDRVFQLTHNINGIVHLAAVSRVIDGEKNPDLCWKTNVEGTRNIIDAALSSDHKPWVIYASSREVYGQSQTFPVSETEPLKPMNSYGKSKHAAEIVVQNAKEKGLATAIIRFSNVYGNIHDYPDRVIPAFCRAAAQGHNIRVDGNLNVFDFTYLDDIIQGILSLIRLLSYGRKSFPPIHLTSGIPTSLRQAAQIAQQASHHPIKIMEGPSRSYDVSRFWGNPNRAQEILHWKACISVEEGMHRLINQYRIFLDNQRS